MFNNQLPITIYKGGITQLPICPFTLLPIYSFAHLRAYKAHSTSVESSLQINLFMQNKANFRKSQMNVSIVYTKVYVNETLGQRGKNEPKTNPNEPNQSQLNPIKANKMPKQTQYEPNQTQCLPAISVAGQRQKNAVEVKLDFPINYV